MSLLPRIMEKSVHTCCFDMLVEALRYDWCLSIEVVLGFER